MKNTIRILHTEWSDGWGGQEIRILGEMIALREKGVELFLACRASAKISEKAHEQGFKVFILPFKGNTDIQTMLGLIKIIKKYKIDIVNTHSGKDTWVGGLAAKFAGAKFIRTRHLSNPIRNSRLNFINELADYIFTTGESVRTDMIENNRISPSKIMSIPTGIDETIFNVSHFKREESRISFNLEDEIVIGIVAVLRQFKRHDIFIKMADKLLIKYPKKKLKFLIAGEGPQRKNIEKMIMQYGLEDKVLLLGHVKNVAMFLNAIDIFVLTSDSKEGVPQSVIQALMMEKPIVSTNAGSTGDLFYKNNFALIDAKDSLDALVKYVSKYIEDDNRLVNASQKRAYIVKHFSKVSMSNKIYAVYKELLKK